MQITHFVKSILFWGIRLNMTNGLSVTALFSKYSL